MINYNDKCMRRTERCPLSSPSISPPDGDVVMYRSAYWLHSHPLLNFGCERDNLMPPRAEIPPRVVQLFTRLCLYQRYYPAYLFVLPQCSHRNDGRTTRTLGHPSFGFLDVHVRLWKFNGFGRLEDAQID